jgi:hypothetical protein
MRFGDSVDVTRGFLALRDSFESTEAYITSLNEQFLSAISEYQVHSPRLSDLSSSCSDDITAGDYVLVAYPDSPPTKLHAPFRGPMLVLEPIRDDGFLCQDIISQSQLQVAKSRLKKFHLPPDFTQAQLLDLARSDHDGDSVDVTRGFLALQDSFESPEAYITSLNEQFLSAISEYQVHSPRLSDLSSSCSDDITAGDYVLVAYPDSPPTKLHAPFRGPMLVLEPIRDDGFLCQDIISQSQLQVAKSRLKKFHLPPDFTQAQLLDLARSDHDEYVVDSICDHRGDPKRKRQLFFKVKWKGFADSEATWEPYSHVRQLAALDAYLATHPELTL